MKATTLIAAFAASAAIGLTALPAHAQWALTGNAAGATDFIGSTNTQDLRIRSNNTEQMRIQQSNGFVGIGTTSPLRRLHINVPNGDKQLGFGDLNGSWNLWGGADFHLTQNTGNVDWIFGKTNTNTLSIGPGTNFISICTGGANQGHVGIGTATVTAQLNVGGDMTPSAGCSFTMGTAALRWNTVYACNGTIQTSDASMKENVKGSTYGIAALKELHPVSFTWRNQPENGAKLGFLAQEVQQVVPEVVKEHGPNLSMGIYYSDLIPVLVKSMQEQQVAIRARAAENDALRERIADRSERIARLEALLGAGR